MSNNEKTENSKPDSQSDDSKTEVVKVRQHAFTPPPKTGSKRAAEEPAEMRVLFAADY